MNVKRSQIRWKQKKTPKNKTRTKHQNFAYGIMIRTNTVKKKSIEVLRGKYYQS